MPLNWAKVLLPLGITLLSNTSIATNSLGIVLLPLGITLLSNAVIPPEVVC